MTYMELSENQNGLNKIFWSYAMYYKNQSQPEKAKKPKKSCLKKQIQLLKIDQTNRFEL